MLTEKKRKILYILFKFSSIIVSCLFPIWAVYEKFPLWTMNYGTGRSMGVGTILILIVFAIVFRKTVFNFIADRFKLKHAPPIFVWLVMLIVAYILLFIANFLADLVTVLWMGVIGCAIGTVLTFIAENIFGNKEKENGIGS